MSRRKEGKHPDAALYEERAKLREAYVAGATRFGRVPVAQAEAAFEDWLQAAVDEVDVLMLDNVIPIRRR